MSYDFHDKVVLITGGNSGIGLACVKKMVSEGARVVTVGRRKLSELQQLTDEEKVLLSKVDYQICDVSNIEEQEKLFTYIRNHYGKLCVAINNAGVIGAMGKQIQDFTVEDYELVININLRGVWVSMQHELRIMLEQGYGSIVNVSSIAGLKARSVSALYGMSKFAISGLTRAAALENAGSGIRVNAVCPAVTETAIFGPESTLLKSKLAKTVPMERIGQPEDIANAVIWLSSDEASFITGITMPIDGGTLA